MKATGHPSNTRVLGAPVGWDQSELPVHALPITDRVLDDHIDTVVSYWKPTPEELTMLNAGALVELSVIGRTMPPVALEVGAAS